MSFKHLDVLKTRKMKLEYVSPPICEGDFTGTGQPTIILDALPALTSPSGFYWQVRGDGFRLYWGSYPGAICYNVWRAVDPENPLEGDYEIIAECIDAGFYDVSAGTYRVSAITPDGETSLSIYMSISGEEPPPPPPGPVDCPVDVPSEAAPSGANAFDITGEVEYPDIDTTALTWTLRDIEGVNYYEAALDMDYPPGTYDLEWKSGFFGAGTQESCGAGNVYGIVHNYMMHDDEHDHADFSYLQNYWCRAEKSLSNPDDFATYTSGPLGSGYTLCQPTNDALESSFATFLESVSGDVRSIFRWRGIAEHTNTGGSISLCAADNNLPAALEPPAVCPTGHELIFKMIQTSGLIQQPRMLRIQDWDTVKLHLSPDIYAYWNGVFSTRVVYTSNTCRWYAAPSGNFGGATVEYTQSLAESPNSCGWFLTIKLGATDNWLGYKIYNDTGDGTYIKRPNTPAGGPPCLVLEEYEL